MTVCWQHWLSSILQENAPTHQTQLRFQELYAHGYERTRGKQNNENDIFILVYIYVYINMCTHVCMHEYMDMPIYTYTLETTRSLSGRFVSPRSPRGPPRYHHGIHGFGTNNNNSGTSDPSVEQLPTACICLFSNRDGFESLEPGEQQNCTL